MKRRDWQLWHAQEYFSHLTVVAGVACVQELLRVNGIAYEPCVF